MTYVADERFSELIGQLEEVHLCEVRQLRLENQRLRAMTPIGVQDVCLPRSIIDIDNANLGGSHRRQQSTIRRTTRASSCASGDGQEQTMSGDDSLEDNRPSLSSFIVPSDTRFSGRRDGSGIGAESARSSGLRSISKRFAEYELRTHWDEVPESARAAWDQGTTIESIEEKTAHAMTALCYSKLSGRKSRISQTLGLQSQHFDFRDAINRSRSRSLRKTFLKRVSKIRMPMVDPGTSRRTAWDFCAAFLILYDLITIPLLVFDPEESVFTDVMVWSCLVFWTLDMAASCCTGRYIDGQLVMSRSIIVKRYLKTWFIVDCIAVVPDWALKMLGTANDLDRVGGLVRMTRTTRVLRLLRLAKLKKLMNQLYDMIANEYMFIVVDLVKLLTIILLLNHIVACLWYVVGELCRKSNYATNWIEDVGDSPVYHGDLAWKYTTSLHWSITQFTAASLDIFATNTTERIFSIFIIFWGLVGLSSFVGNVTTTITALRNMSNDHQKQFWLLRKYLAQCRVSQQLTVRVLRYLEFKEAAKKNILPASNVLMLSHLSEQLISQLKKETHKPILGTHPYFGVLDAHMTSFMDRICNRALEDTEYAEDDVVFNAAQEAKGMFFVKAGSFLYAGDFELQRNGFLSEAALWTGWWHRESLVANGGMNEIIVILHAPFGEVMCMHPHPWNFAQAYAEDFVKVLNDHDPDSLSDISMNGFVKMLREHHIAAVSSDTSSCSGAASIPKLVATRSTSE